MQTIDEIQIEEGEDGFHLIVFTDESEHRFRIGLPDQIKSEVDRTIGAWLAEGEAARATMPTSDGWVYESGADAPYPKGSPKHPMWHENASGIYDNREGK